MRVWMDDHLGVSALLHTQLFTIWFYYRIAHHRIIIILHSGSGYTCHEQSRPSRYLYLVRFNSITDCWKSNFSLISSASVVMHMTKQAMRLDFIWTQNQIENWLNLARRRQRRRSRNLPLQIVAGTWKSFCKTVSARKWSYMDFDGEYDRCAADSVTLPQRESWECFAVALAQRDVQFVLISPEYSVTQSIF